MDNFAAESKLQAWFEKRVTKRMQSEAGNSFILYFMLMPLLFAFFGLATDVAGAEYVKGSLQSSLDAATQAAVAASSNPPTGTTPGLTIDQARATVYSVFEADTNNVPFVACQGTTVPFKAGNTPVAYTETNGTPCGFSVGSFTYTPNAAAGQNAVTISVTEYSKYLFLAMIGFDYQTYNLQSSAVLTQAIQ
jgi:Flp pilus assembly protein TadG